jgi:hypothetical protein
MDGNSRGQVSLGSEDFLASKSIYPLTAIAYQEKLNQMIIFGSTP